jgi:hypothetical protein
MVFTVIRATRSQAGGGAGRIICCSVPVESQVFTPRPNAVNEIPVNLPVKNTVDVINGEPIEVVDYLAISPLSLDSSPPVNVSAGSSANASFIAPAIRAGQERLNDGTLPGRTVLVNAEIEPCAGTVARAPRRTAKAAACVPPPAAVSNTFKVSSVKRGRDGSLTLILDLPGPGRIVVNATANRPGARSSAKRKKSKKITVSKRTTTATRAGALRIKLKPRSAAKRLLKRRNLPANLEITFTPNGGSARTETKRATFKKIAKKRKRR